MSRILSSTASFLVLLASIVSGCAPSNEVDTASNHLQPSKSEVVAGDAYAPFLGTWSQISPLSRGDTETERFTFKQDGTFQYVRLVMKDGREYSPSMHGTWKKTKDIIHFNITETDAAELTPVESFEYKIVEQTSEVLNFITLRLDDELFDESNPGIPRTFLERVH